MLYNILEINASYILSLFSIFPFICQFLIPDFFSISSETLLAAFLHSTGWYLKSKIRPKSPGNKVIMHGWTGQKSNDNEGD